MTTSSSSRPDPFQEVALERGPEEECLATFWQQATPGASYVRLFLPSKYLPAQTFTLENGDLDWDNEADQVLVPRQRGAAVWQFLGDDWRSRISFALQDQGVRTLMEVDDNYTKPHPHHKALNRKSWLATIREASKPGATGYSNEMHRLLIPEMDGIIVSTPYLRQVYLEYTDEVFLCPNTVDPVDWEDLPERKDDAFRIVYSASRSHVTDAPQLRRALKWASRQKGVEVWIQGISMPWTFATHVQWTDSLSAYRKSLANFDVGLAPLVGGEWADGKSDLKALEYTMAGVAPLLALEEPYRPWFDKPDLMVESNEDAWMDKIKWIVRNRDAVPELLEQSRRYVLNERTTETNVWRWRKAINGE